MFESLRPKSQVLQVMQYVLLLVLIFSLTVGTLVPMVCLLQLAAFRLWFWHQALQNLRTLKNTPISTIASAAQGMVELEGVAEPASDAVLLSHWKKRPCLWCGYVLESDGKNWTVVDSGETSAPFLLRDASGVCVIQPESAEILTRHRERWMKSGQRFTELTLRSGDALRVRGQFRTYGGSADPFDSRAALSATLREWKKDMPRLLSRFDLNGDGQLGPQEWQLARTEAMRTVFREKARLQEQEATHTVDSPTPCGFFVVSNVPRAELRRRHLYSAWFHLVVFFFLCWFCFALGFGKVAG